MNHSIFRMDGQTVLLSAKNAAGAGNARARRPDYLITIVNASGTRVTLQTTGSPSVSTPKTS